MRVERRLLSETKDFALVDQPASPGAQGSGAQQIARLNYVVEQASNSQMTDWANDLSEDYHAAAVRLVTLTENRVQHLLFASIELHPHEIPPPPPAIEPQRKNFGEATLRVSLVVMLVRDALNWYQSVLSGSMKVPGLSQEVAVTTARFSPEPILGRLLISNELPFALAWHGGLRIHRLIPMEDLPETVADLISAKESEKQTTIRTWLDDRLGFDLLAYDDFLGGVVLLAPNPVARGVGTYIKEILPGGRERLGVKAAVRQGVDPRTLHVRLSEERPGGISVLESRLDQFGMTEFVVPEQTHRLGLELACDKRGVLSIRPPAHFFRNFHITSQTTIPQGTVEVPARRRGGPSKTIPLMTVRPGPARQTAQPTVISGALRLYSLQTRREARTGYRRPDGFFQSTGYDERILFNDRVAAVSFVHGLTRHAGERVIFVDPFFDEKDVREFALVTLYEGISVSVLTGRGENLFWKMTGAEDNARFPGDTFANDLEALNADLQSKGRSAPTVLLMGDTARVYHDRFLVVDDVVWHFGHSFNQIGYAEVSLAARLLHPEEIRSLILEDVGNAAAFLTTWPALRMRRQAGDDS